MTDKPTPRGRNARTFTNVALVGVFTAAALVVLAVLIMRTEDWNPFGSPGVRYHADFTSVAGLDDKSSVRVAGVKVGRVDGIALVENRARVTMLIQTPLDLTAGATAAIRNMGLLGDKYVELVPGPPGGATLEPGAVLAGTTPPSIDDALAKLDQVASSVQSFTSSLAGGDSGNRLAEMFDNLAAMTGDLRQLVADNRESVNSTLGNVELASSTLAAELPRLAEQLSRMLDAIEQTVAENRGNLREGLGNVKELTDKVQVSVDNLNAITDKLARGEGTIGKLLNSEEAHDELVATLDSVQGGVEKLSSTLGRVEKLKLDLALEGAYLAESEESRTAFTLRLNPGSGAPRFYLIEAVDDPRGKVKTKTDVITTTHSDGTTTVETIERVTTEDKLLLSAQFGFDLSDRLSLRAGLIESTGGAAVDYRLFDRRLALSLEAFDFDRQGDLDPNLRLRGRWAVHPNLFVVGGYDDLLVSDRRSVFVGGGITWSDDDLKYLLGSLPLGGF